jgi:hypothetical protein
MNLDWLKKVAPYVSTALTGNAVGLATIAAKDLIEVLGTDTSVDLQKPVESVLSVLQGGLSSEQLQDIKKIEKDFEIKMKELGYKNLEELEKIAFEDRKSAREREVQVRDNTPKILAYLVTVGFFGVLAYMIIHGLPPTGSEPLLIMLGSLGSAWVGVISYYFGSSSGSQMKTELLNRKDKL